MVMPMPKPAFLARLAFTFCLCSSLLFFSLAALALGRAASGTTGGGSLRLPEVVKSLGALRPKNTTFVKFNVANVSSHEIRLLGVGAVCAEWGCVYGTGFPIKVPPKTAAEIAITLRISARFSGELSTQVTLFSDAPGSEQIGLGLLGRVAREGEAISERAGVDSKG
jgi:hypothetical protein